MSSNKGSKWPVTIFVFYGLFVLALLFAVFFTLDNDMEMVTSNYYEKTLKYEEQIERIKNTHALNAQPKIAFNKEKTILVLTMPEISGQRNFSGKINFFRPSNSKWDKRVNLQCDDQGKQLFPLSNLETGKWQIQILWADGKKEYYFEKVIII